MRVLRFGGVVVVSMIAIGLGVSKLHAQQGAAPEKAAFAAADEKILAEVHDHNEIMANLEYLSDEIGARLTGSSQLKQANDWTADMFRKYGLTNVHLEPWTIAHSWTRGTARARSRGAPGEASLAGPPQDGAGRDGGGRRRARRRPQCRPWPRGCAD